MADPKPLTRNQIAAFVGNDPEAVLSIERLFKVAGQLTPGEIATLNEAIDANTLALGAGQPQVEAINAIVSALQNTVQGLALAPPVVPPKRRVYGSFYDLGVQVAALPNTAYTVTLSSTDLSFGVYLSGSQIVVSQDGFYNFQHSIQIDSSAGGPAIFYLWYAKNGTDVAQSARRWVIPSALVATVATGNYLFQLKANDYIEFKWATDDVGLQIERALAAAPVPVTPAVIVTVSDNVGG